MRKIFSHKIYFIVYHCCRLYYANAILGEEQWLYLIQMYNWALIYEVFSLDVAQGHMN